MPTSLCSGQVARLVAEHMNARAHESQPERGGVSSYVALAHTEGCGSVNSETLFLRTLCGHLRHPNVRRAVLLEHGCEKTHNDAVRHYMGDEHLESDRYGYASVQLDGGMAAVTGKIERWLDDSLSADPPPQVENVDASHLHLALLASGTVNDVAADLLAGLALSLVAAGATVTVPHSGALAASKRFRSRLMSDGANGSDGWHATIAYGQVAPGPGLHVMESPTEAPMEVLTGLGGTGAQLMLCHTSGAPLATHPMIPMLQMASDADTISRYGADLDLVFDEPGDTGTVLEQINQCLGDVASRRRAPKLFARGLSGFQVTRGLLGVSL